MGKKIVYWAVLIVSVLLNLFLAGVAAKAEREKTNATIIDTLIVRDTVLVVEPMHIKETIVLYDTVFFPMFEEMERNEQNEQKCAKMSLMNEQNELDSLSNVLSDDSVMVVVPITQKVYEDSLYKAWVSGYNQRLDSLLLYRKEVYIPMVIETKVKPKVVVSAGVYGGFGVKGADYGLGISVGVPIWSW